MLGYKPDIKHGPLDVRRSLNAVQGPVDVRLQPHVQLVYRIRTETPALVVDDRGLLREVYQVGMVVVVVVVGRVWFAVYSSILFIVRPLHAQEARQYFDEHPFYPWRHLVRGR